MMPTLNSGSPLRSLRAGLTALAADCRGVIGIVFAVMLPLLLLTIGAGVDYTRAMQAREALQTAADAAALGAVVAYSASGSSSTGSTVGNGYISSSTAVLPPILTNVTWTGPTFTAPSVVGAGVFTPYLATVSVTATVKSLLLRGAMPNIQVTVSATAADPVASLAGNGNCNTGAGDTDTVYAYSVPRGMTGNYVPDISKFASSQILFTNTSYSQCQTGNYQPPASTNVVGFAFKDVTGGNGGGSSACDYNYFGTAIQGNYDAGHNMNNNQYGSQCGSSNWLFSTAWPPTLATTQAPGYTSCASVGDCSGSGDSGIYQLYHYNSPSSYPGASGADNALQVYQMNGNPSAASGTLTEPTGGAQVLYNYTTEFTDLSAPTGKCVLSDLSANHYCQPFSATSNQGKTVKNTGALDCSKHGGKAYMFFWNDMGGYPEDIDYFDMNYYYSCGNTASSVGAAVNYFAYLAK